MDIRMWYTVQSMNDFLRTLLNTHRLRLALRDLSFEQIREAREKFEAVFAEREQYEIRQRVKSAERRQKLAEFTEMLKEAGIEPSELVSSKVPEKANGVPKVRRLPRPGKYRYIEGDMAKTWTGQGRMPKAISLAIERGQVLEDFLL